MTNFSPNMLKTFQACPQKYKFKYVDNISLPQKSSFFEKGKKVHALANYYLQGNDISKLEKALNETEMTAWQNLKNNEFFNMTYVNSEYNLSCKIGSHWIGGRLDALVKTTHTPTPSHLKGKGNEVYYILDYKTGSIPKNPEYDYQTMVYLLCASKKLNSTLTPTMGHKVGIKFVYIDLKNNQNCVIDFTPQRQKEYEKAICEICDKIENFQFSENIEHQKICDFCEYKKICI